MPSLSIRRVEQQDFSECRFGGLGIASLLQEHVAQDNSRSRSTGSGGWFARGYGAHGHKFALLQKRACQQHCPIQFAGGRLTQPAGDDLDVVPFSQAEIELAQTQPGRGEIRAFVRDSLPLRLGLGPSALILVEHCEVVPRLVAAQAGIHAGEMITLVGLQQLQQSRFRTASVANPAEDQALQEEQFGVIRIKGAAGPARLECVLDLIEPPLALDDQGVKLAHDRIGRVRIRQASFQKRQGFGQPPSSTYTDPMLKRINGSSGSSAIDRSSRRMSRSSLARRKGRVLVSDMTNCHISPLDPHSRSAAPTA